MPRYHSRTRRVKRRSIAGPIALVVVTVLIGVAVAALWNRDRIRDLAGEYFSEAAPVASDAAVAGPAFAPVDRGDPSPAEAQGSESHWRPPAGFESGDITFRLADARVGRVPVRTTQEHDGQDHVVEFFEVRVGVAEGQLRTEEDLLTIELEASNLSHHRAAPALVIADLMDARGARLEDDAGHRYRPVTFGSGHEPRLPGHSAHARPGEVVRLGLIFEKPLAQARELTLTIPAERFGGSGQVVLRFDPPP